MYCAPQVNNISGFEAVLISEFMECTVHHSVNNISGTEAVLIS